MTPLRKIAGRAYPFGRANVDTDTIIPGEYLKVITRAGLARGAFEAVRSEPGNVFDDPRFAGAPILIAGANYGCGSSREHAAWAMADLGIRAVIAPSFSDIHAGNAFKNGILTVELTQAIIDRLMVAAHEGAIAIDLAAQQVTTASGDTYAFAIDPFRKACLLEGLDEIAITLADVGSIAAHEGRAAMVTPWMAGAAGGAAARG